jgi:hypothetical protein
MKRILWVAALATLMVVPVFAQQTPKPTVAAYDALADVILGVRQAESDFVKAMLHNHYLAAKRDFEAGDFERSAAQMALFGNEGDNAVAGIRKRLVEGGHHHNAAGEDAGIYDEGFVIVTKKDKNKALAASKALREAKDEAARAAAWKDFDAVAKPLTHSK